MAGYNYFRCTCDQCACMRNQEEQNCCHSYPDLVEYMNEFDVDCITDHPGFQHVVLNPYVVETAYYSYRKTEYMWGRLSIRERSNYGMYRYAAYRQFVRMCWGIVGEDNRIILPACVYTAIRNTFYPGYSNILNYY